MQSRVNSDRILFFFFYIISTNFTNVSETPALMNKRTFICLNRKGVLDQRLKVSVEKQKLIYFFLFTCDALF